MCFLKKGNKGNKPLQKMIKYSNCKAFRNLIQANTIKCYFFTIINIKYLEIINLFVP